MFCISTTYEIFSDCSFLVVIFKFLPFVPLNKSVDRFSNVTCLRISDIISSWSWHTDFPSATGWYLPIVYCKVFIICVYEQLWALILISYFVFGFDRMNTPASRRDWELCVSAFHAGTAKPQGKLLGLFQLAVWMLQFWARKPLVWCVLEASQRGWGGMIPWCSRKQGNS